MNYPELIKLAYDLARKGPDPSSQNAAIIVSNLGQQVSAVNQLPAWAGTNYADRDYKLKYVTHAEEGAILEAARLGVSTREATMICPWAACLTCAKLIVRSGITTLVRHRQRMELSHWDLADAEKVLENINVIEIDGTAGVSILANGKRVYL